MSTSAVIENADPTTPAQRAVSEHLRLLSAPDIERWSQLFAPDGVLAWPFAPDGMPSELHGTQALFEGMIGFPEVASNMTVTSLRFFETTDPLEAIAEFTWTARAKATGKEFEQHAVAVMRTDASGRVLRLDDFWNPLRMLEALEMPPYAP